MEHLHLLEGLAHLGVVVDYDERDARVLEVAGDLAPDPPEPAEQIVVVELGDLSLHKARLEQSRKVAGHEQLGERDQQEEHRTDAEGDQGDLGNLTADRFAVWNRPTVATVSSDQSRPCQ